jgi:hypothetical protein
MHDIFQTIPLKLALFLLYKRGLKKKIKFQACFSSDQESIDTEGHSLLWTIPAKYILSPIFSSILS